MPPWIVRARVVDVNTSEKDEFLDVIQADTQKLAKGIAIAYIADQGYEVEEWIIVADLENLRNVVRNI